MKILNFIKNIISFDDYLTEKRKNDMLKQKMIVASIIAFAFLALSVANIFEHSYFMLILTATSAVALLLFILIGYLSKSAKVISFAICLICLIQFTIFIFIRGNDGFALLWIAFVPIVSMLIIDFRIGFFVSAYFIILLPVLFWTPLKSFLADGYTQTFLLRFPFYYDIFFVFSMFLCYNFKKNEYDLFMKQNEIIYEKDFDQLTGIYNRTKYMAKINGSFLNYDSIGIIFLDVNFLKYVNDTFGHAAGDDLIVTTAKSLKKTAENDAYYAWLFRIGGDEFVVALKNCQEGDCERFIEEWKQNLEEIKNKDSKYEYSVSYGYCFSKKEFNLIEMIKDADNKMYAYKRAYYEKLKQDGTYQKYYGNK